MTPFPWYRFYSEALSDRKIARVCRSSALPKATVIGVWAILLSLASESPQRGLLLISDDIPLTPDELQEECGLDAAAFNAVVTGFVACGLIEIGGDAWEIVNWDKRQPASDNGAERVRRHRASKAVTVTPPPSNGVTLPKRYSNALDIDIDKERDTEGEERARDHEPARLVSPPPIVKTIIPDRTPGRIAARAYLAEPEEPPPAERQPDPQAIAAGHMANAITDVTGISAKLNREAVYECAAALVEAGYAPDQLRMHYGREQFVGRWNWYADDWRGKKGERPGLKQLRETIAGAVANSAAPVAQKKVGPVDRFLAGLMGNAQAIPATD